MGGRDSPGEQERLLIQRVQRAIDQRRLRLPLLPRVVTEVLRLADDADTGARRLAELIRADQTLAAHVLRMANAAAFAGPDPTVSLDQAVARLGAPNIAEIALAATLGPTLFVAPGCERLVQALWRRALATALWAREMAQRSHRDAELAFLCGLLHQIGQPAVLLEAIAASRADTAMDEALLQRVMERFATPVGIELATRWQLPDAVVATIAVLGRMDFRSQFQDVVEVVVAARLLAALSLGELVLAPAELAGRAELAPLALSPGAVAALLEREAAIRAFTEALAL